MVADRFQISPSTVKRLLRQRRELGNIDTQYHNCGASAKITQSNRDAMRELLMGQPDLTLTEVRDCLELDCMI